MPGTEQRRVEVFMKTRSESKVRQKVLRVGQWMERCCWSWVDLRGRLFKRSEKALGVRRKDRRNEVK